MKPRRPSRTASRTRALFNGIYPFQVQTAAYHTLNLDSSNGSVNNWAAPGVPSASAFDFRSDTITTPTASMLQAIATTTLLDDVFVEDTTTNSFEASIAEMTGFPAGLFVLSGTMGNQISMRTHLTAPPHAILCDHRSHVLEWEAGGVATLSQAIIKGVEPSNGTYLTLEDIQAKAVLSDDVHACPTRVISLENTLGGTIMPLAETRRISAWAREQGLIMHLDGARLWEAAAAGAGTIKEYSSCFDSVSLCFSKGLGAPVGSVIVGSQAFVKRARWIRKSIGGGIRQAGVLSAPMRVALEETFLGGQLQASHERARKIAAIWESYGGKLAMPVETNMVWLDLKSANLTVKEFIAVARDAGITTLGGRLVVHYQICDEAVDRLDKLMKGILEGEKSGVTNGANTLKRKEID